MDVPRAVYFWLGLVAFWSVVLTIIFRAEKRMVWPFGELQPVLPPKCDPTGYGSRWVNDAAQAGWKMLGWSRDIKFIKYNIYYALMISPDQSTCAVIGTGQMGPMVLKATWLYTPTADGRTLYTTDNQTGVTIDLSGNWRNQLVFAPNFGALYLQHQAWLHSANAMPRKFTAGREMSDLRAVRDEHFNAMERAGLIFFTDPAHQYFNFTLLGAAKSAPWGYLVGLSRALSRGRFPKVA
jgi:hypothetical protein